MDDRSADQSPYLLRGERDVIRLRNPTEDKRALRRMLTSADLLNRAAYGYPGYQRFFSRAAGIFGVG